MATRLTQEALEALQQGGSPNTRVSQIALESLQQGGVPKVRNSQIALEILGSVSLLQITGSGGVKRFSWLSARG